MLAALLLPFASQAQETVTIGDGTSTTYVTPFNSLWGYSFVEQIYLASEIGTDGNITAVRFQQTTSTSQTNNITLYMKNVTRSTFSSTSDIEPVSASDIVYTGSVTFASGWVEIQLDQPFEYDGSSNLLVAMHEYTPGYSSIYFNYTSATDRVVTFHSDSYNPDPYNLGSYGGNSYTSPNRANIQLDIEPVGEVSCNPVRLLRVVETAGHTATLSWVDTNNTGSYDIYQITPSAVYDSILDTIFLTNTSDTTYTISNLDPDTTYRFGVAANCGADGSSNIRFINATTTVACPVPTSVNYALTSVYSTVDVSWVDHNASAWELRYWTGTDTSEIIQLEDTVYSIENLLPNTNYRFQVRAVCGDEDGYSLWTPASGRSFTTPLACRLPVELTAVLDPSDPTSATITWVDSIASAWQVAFNGDTLDLIDVTETSISFDTLTPETTYTIMVRANCGDDVSPWTSALSFEPSAKTVIGTAQTTNSYLPAYSTYNYGLTQQIYTAAELGEAGMITSVDFKNGGSTQTRNIDVYMVYTEDSAFASTTSWITATTANLVFSGNVTFTAGVWTTITFDNPFFYNGTSNVALIVDDNTGSWESGPSFYVFNAPSQALRVHDDYTDFDPTNPSDASSDSDASLINEKNYVRFLKTEVPECMPITMLTVLENTVLAHEATLTWEGESDSYLVEYKEASDSVWTEETATDTTITLTNLNPVTTYNVRVTAICGGEYSLTSGAVSFTTPLACQTPANFVANIVPGSGNMAVVTWTDTIATGWQIALIHGTDTSYIDVTDTTGYTFDTLTAEETYTAMVRANCEDINEGYSPWSNAKTFVPTNAYLITVADGTNTNDYVPVYGLWTDNNIHSRFIVPAENLTPMTYGLINSMTFYASQSSVSWGAASFQVYLSTTDATTVNTLTDVSDMETVYSGSLSISNNQMVVTFTNPYLYLGGNLMIAFEEPTSGSYSSCTWYGVSATGASMGGYGSSVSQQNFLPKTTFGYTPGDAPDCLPVSGLAVTDITVDSATIYWTSEAGNYNIYALGDDTTLVANTTDTFYVFGELTPMTNYSYGVRAVCSGIESLMRPINFTTACAIVAMPFSENFDGLTSGIPMCWDNSEGTTTSASYKWNSYATGHDGRGLRFDSYLNSTGNTNVLATPTITITEEAQLSFWYMNPTGGNFTVMVGIAGTTERTTLANNLTGVSSWTLAEIVLPDSLVNEDVIFYFKGTSNYGSGDAYIYLDEIYVEEVPTCIPASNLSVTNIGGHTATINWDGEAASYNVYAITSTDTTLVVNVTDNTVDITGLDPETHYIYGVRAVCDGDESPLRTISFTTGIACIAPTGVAVSLTPGNGSVATVTWVDNIGSAWQVRLIHDTDTTYYDATDSTSYDLTGLTAEETYKVAVRTNCTAAEDGYSAWSSNVTFVPTNAYMLTVNDGTTTNSYVPIYGYYVDDLTQSTFIIPAADLTGMEYGEISQLTFYASNANINWGAASFQVYMAETTDSTVSSMANLTTMTQVYSGSLSIVNNQMVVALTTPFMYMGGNLMIAFNQTVEGTYVSCSWYGVTASGASVGGYGSSINQRNFLPKMTFNYTPGNLNCSPVSNLEVVASNHSAQVSWVDTIGSAWMVMVNGDTANAIPVTTTNYTLTGLASDSTYTVSVSTNCGADGMSSWRNVTFTTLEECPLPFGLNAENVTSSTATLNWNGASNYTVRYRIASGVNEDFESSSMNGWTTIDADGDGDTWELATTHMGSGYGHNGSVDMVLSHSYFSGEALTPDNYLVSPQVALGGSISFWAAAQDANYAAEHFGVAVSTAGNTSAADFTTIQEWTMSATGATPGAKVQGDWVQLTVDLSAYAGQTGYVAIRHFNCTDMFYLDIDDIVITTPTVDTWTEVNVTNNSYAVSGLQPMTTYEFQVHASCADDSVWSVPAYFTTDSGDIIIIDSFTVTLASANTTMGTVSPTGTQTVLANASFTATANPLTGYHFVAWMNGSTQVSTANPYTFTVTANTSLTATFEADAPGENYYTVTVNYDSTMGTVTGIPAEPVLEGSNVTLQATALTGHKFVAWVMNNDTVSHDASYTITNIVNNVTIYAIFKSTVSIEDAELSNVNIFSANSTIYVKGAEGQNIYIYDLNGRIIATKLNATETMEIPMEQTGVYLVRVGNASAKRVIVMR